MSFIQFRVKINTASHIERQDIQDQISITISFPIAHKC